MTLLSVLDILLMIVGGAGMIYQGLCIVMSLFAKPVRFPDASMTNRYAVLISARNEEKRDRQPYWVDSRSDLPVQPHRHLAGGRQLHRQHRRRGAVFGLPCVERHNLELVGKGYALTYLLGHMLDIGVADDYEAYFVFDADNKLDKHYFEEMNKAFCSGFKILTSYRNSVNLADNWVSSGSALWFIRESRFLSNSRMILGSSCHVGGTGFMFSREVMKRNKGWKFHLLTEDLEFTMDSILHGDRIGYCGTAILYDEQPVTFSQSWRQRLRWSKGFLQVFRYYGSALLKRAVRERDFSCIDFTLMLCPFTVLGVIRAVMGLLFAACGFVSWPSQLRSLASWSSGIIISVLGLMALAALTIIVERDQIGATNKELLAYVLSFPIYILSYVPISFQAIFAKAQWKPIAHKG